MLLERETLSHEIQEGKREKAVPPFVTEGEEIVVDPVENRYIERAR